LRGSAAVFCLLLECLSTAPPVRARAPQIFHNPYYESPVQAGPDDLIFLGGLGFARDDRVVYRAAAGPEASSHPTAVPALSTRELGTARVVRIDDPAYSLTINLPGEIDAHQSYTLWVVNAAGEWSEPFSINDPRPLWFSPDFAYATAQFAGLNRRFRVIGRNLAARSGSVRIQLRGPHKYTSDGANATAENRGLKSEGDAFRAHSRGQAVTDAEGLQDYVIEAALPSKLIPGLYAVSINVDGTNWIEVPEQKLQVLDDPHQLPTFGIGDARFGGCRPDDRQDDRECLFKALDEAHRSGGGVVEIPVGTWDLFPGSAPADPDSELVVSQDVQLQGAGSDTTKIVWHDSPHSPDLSALLLLEGNNSVTGLQFLDERRFDTRGRSRPVIQLGHDWRDRRVISGQAPDAVRSIVIADNRFRHVGEAIGSGALPVQRLFVVHNEFAGFAEDLYLPGSHLTVGNPFRIDDSIIRWNTFLPGSYLDVRARQGVIATELGASRRVDFSSNVADGASREGLQNAADQPGWRAGFFWNLSNNSEQLLVADNEINCPGDKSGDGEAIGFDDNGNAEAYPGMQTVDAAQTNSLVLRGQLLVQEGERFAQRRGTADAASSETGLGQPHYSDYQGYWIQVVQGPGLGQTRKIRGVSWDAASSRAVFQIFPAWDVIPSAGQSSVIITRQFWQTYVVANSVNQSTPTCSKSNLNGPRGGLISIYAPAIDSTVQHNRQHDTDGIAVAHTYEVRTPSCPQCLVQAFFQTALDVRANVIEGEYDWSSDCSNSGLRANFGAAPTPEAPPPAMGFGVQFSHNVISHADGLRGGAIDVAPVWSTGPEPGRWRLIDNLIIAHNTVRDINGPPPAGSCKLGQRGRPGINLQGPGNVYGTVLYKNTCEQVATPLTDLATATTRVCSEDSSGTCECP
jgi:hypothetical protein